MRGTLRGHSSDREQRDCKALALALGRHRDVEQDKTMGRKCAEGVHYSGRRNGPAIIFAIVAE
eukprot:COSAG02_NODE_2566_length_8519_cov_3.109857_3_plen_63_part_00